MNNHDWLRQVCSIKEEAWHMEKVIRIDQVENYEFYKDAFMQYKALVNPRQIRGIQYTYDYKDTNDNTISEPVIRQVLVSYLGALSNQHKRKRRLV